MNKAHEDINWVNYPLTDTALNASNLNKMDRSIDVIDDRVVAMDTTKANTTDMLQAFIDVDIDDTTGTLTFTKKNGTTVTLNTNLNKIATNMRYDADPSSATYQKLILTYNTTPVTYGYIDLTALITQYEFTDSSIIHFSVTSGMVSATIIDGSITAEKLQPNFLADCQSAKNDAESAQQGANQNALISEGWAKGTQNGIAVTSQSPYYHNNSEWFKDQAQEIAGGSLAGLSDTEIDNPTQGQVLVYDEVSEVWINSNPSEGILPHLHILTESDATVTIAGLTPVQTSAGVWDVDIPSYGTYLVQSVNSSGTQNVSVVVDTCKIYEVSAYHFNATITVTFPGSATCTCSKSGVTYTATSTPYTFNVNSAGNWMISITEDGQTVAQNVEITTTGQTESLTLDFAYIALTIPSELIGQTVTITDGTSTRTWVSSATTHTFVCILGNYTLSIGGYSTSVNVVAYTTYTASIETWGYKGWLASAGIADTFGSLDNLIADEATIRTLMTKHVSSDYLYNWYTHDSSILSTILSNTNTVKWFGLRDYVCDKFMANVTAKTAILASANWAYILKDKVPIMTSNTAPYGEAISNSTYSGYPTWRAFDNDTSTLWGANVTGTTPNAYCGYKFVNPICIRKVKILPRQDSYSTNSPKNYTVDASNDGSNWTTLLTVTDALAPSASGEYIENDINNDNYYLYYRVNTTQTQVGADRLGFSELQFYGRALNVSVPYMTGANAPFGEVVGSFGRKHTNLQDYQVFQPIADSSSARRWFNLNVEGSYIGYKFTAPTIVKMIEVWDVVDAGSTTSLGDSVIKGSNDGTTWETVASINVPASNALKARIPIDNNTAYLYYAIAPTTYSANTSLNYLNFYGIDESEHTERHYIYDNGIEVETLATTGTITKGVDKLTLGASSSTAKASIDTTDYSLLRGTTKDNASGTVALVCGGGSSTFTSANMPNNQSLDISSINGSNDTGVSMTASGTFDVAELWLE